MIIINDFLFSTNALVTGFLGLEHCVSLEVTAHALAKLKPVHILNTNQPKRKLSYRSRIWNIEYRNCVKRRECEEVLKW